MKSLVTPLAFAVAAFALARWRADVPSAWFDELATTSAIDRSPAQLWAMLGNIDAVHGLYYFAVRSFAVQFGTDVAALRAFSAIGMAAATAGCVVLARRLVDLRFAVVVGVLALVLPRLTWSGVEARSYSWVIAVAVLVLLAAQRAARVGTRLAWLGYGLAVLLSTVLFLYSWFLTLAVVAGIAWTVPRSERRRELRAAALASVGALIVASPVVVTAVLQRDQVSWLAWPGWRLFPNVAIDQWFDHSLAFAAVAWLMAVAAGVLWWRRGVPERLRPAVRWGAVTAVVPVAVMVAVSPVVPMYVGRYVSFTVPGVLLVLAAAVLTLADFAPAAPRRSNNPVAGSSVVGALLVGVLVAAAIPGLLWQRSPLSKPGGSDFTYAARYIADNARPGDCLYFQVQPSWASPTLRITYDGSPGVFAALTDMGSDGDRRERGKLWDKARGVNQWARWTAQQDCTVGWVLADADRAEPDFQRENGNVWWTFRRFQFMGSDMRYSLDQGGLVVVHQEQFHILQVVKLERVRSVFDPEYRPRAPRTQHQFW